MKVLFRTLGDWHLLDSGQRMTIYFCLDKSGERGCSFVTQLPALGESSSSPPFSWPVCGQLRTCSFWHLLRAGCSSHPKRFTSCPLMTFRVPPRWSAPRGHSGLLAVLCPAWPCRRAGCSFRGCLHPSEWKLLEGSEGGALAMRSVFCSLDSRW